MLKSLLFDLDGVIADSRVAITRCLNHALLHHGFEERPEDELARHIGPPLLVAFQDLVAAQGGDPAIAEACVGTYRERYRWSCTEETLLYPAVGSAVGELAGRLPLAVATSKPEAFAAPILEALGLRDAFRVVVGPPLDPKAEPKSRTVARTLESLGVPGPSAIVGDRRHDVEAGRANGIATIGVTWGFGPRTELETAGADHIVETPAALVSLIDALV